MSGRLLGRRREREPGLLGTLRVDIAEFAKVKSGSSAPEPAAPADLAGTVDIVTLPGFWALVLWRLGNRWHHGGLKGLSRLTYMANLVLFGADLPAGATVGPGMVIPHPAGVVIASDVVFGARCRLLSHTRIGGSGRPDRPGHPVLGDDVWVMDGAGLFGPLTVGDRSVVGASVVLSEDVPPDTLVLVPRPTPIFRPRRRRDLRGLGNEGAEAATQSTEAVA